jgi:hypothetical protein
MRFYAECPECGDIDKLKWLGIKCPCLGTQRKLKWELTKLEEHNMFLHDELRLNEELRQDNSCIECWISIVTFIKHCESLIKEDK